MVGSPYVSILSHGLTKSWLGSRIHWVHNPHWTPWLDELFSALRWVNYSSSAAYSGWWWLEPWNFEWLSRNSWEWNNHPNWRTPSFFRGVETTNQHMIWPDFTWFEIFKRQHIGILRGTLGERWVGLIMGIVHGENWPYCILMELTSVMSPSDFAKLPGPLIIIGVPFIAKCHTMSYCHYFRGTPVINQPGSIDSRYSPVIFPIMLGM